MWRRIEYNPARSRQIGRTPAKKAELIGGPLDGLTIGGPPEPYAQFILLPTDGAYRGPYPIHTYRYDPQTGRYFYGGRGVQAPAPRAAR